MNKEELAVILERGGIFRNIKGSTPKEVLNDLISSLPIIPAIPKDSLLQAVLEREALMPTGIGRGIAIPHPRNPVIPPDTEQLIALAFLENPVDWNSLDGEKVNTLFLIISSSAKEHLLMLSCINFLCRDENFHKMLMERSSLDKLLSHITEAEKQWKSLT